MADKVIITFWIDEETKRDYRIEAARRGITMSELFRRCAEDYAARSFFAADAKVSSHTAKELATNGAE